MYEFIETLHKELSITSNDITALEKEYKISIPTPLKDFYLKYNASEISLCTFTQKEMYALSDFLIMVFVMVSEAVT